MLKANNGDLVRILEGADLGSAGMVGNVSVGDIVEISRVHAIYDLDLTEYYVKDVRFNGGEFFLYDNEFELFRKAGEEDAEVESDAVHHPNHYTQGKFETIEIIEAITDGYDNGYVAYAIGNALKYLARAPFKHASPIEDLRKAATYLDFAIKAYEAKEALN